MLIKFERFGLIQVKISVFVFEIHVPSGGRVSTLHSSEQVFTGLEKKRNLILYVIHTIGLLLLEKVLKSNRLMRLFFRM